MFNTSFSMMELGLPFGEADGSPGGGHITSFEKSSSSQGRMHPSVSGSCKPLAIDI